ncbi:MAG: TonB-dependent receptor [Calditrichaceae bacterium]|nr:TonB-dependent receptor [Calditrichia bacterium]NUQ41585.1 TonB-dependent receptor [Calditrichaceae bacterium]
MEVSTLKQRDYFSTIPLILFSLLMLAFSSRIMAGTTGKIAGQVIDEASGDPLPGVNVYVENYPFGGATDADGFFFMLNIPPGKYTVVIQMLGYQEVRYKDVKVNVDLTTQLNTRLKAETIQGSQVVVVADRPLIQKDVTSTQVKISSDEIRALPVEDYNDIIQLQAGVIDGHFRGGRLGEVAYMVDGLSVIDPFYNEVGVQVENSFIQELEVISGTFNAEYGQAMSGVVNIVTKDGGPKLEGSVSGYVGNYVTSHDEIYPNLDNIDGTGFQNLEASLSGPLPFWKAVKFFFSGRYINDDGNIYGERVYTIEDNDPFSPSGDRAYVAMNDFQRATLQGKLSYYLIPQLKISYSLIYQDYEGRGYDHAFQLSPDGIKDLFEEQYHHNLSFNHTLSKSTFHTLKFSANWSNYQGYVFENPYDPRYVIPERGQPASGYTFRSGGNQNDRYDRTSQTYIGKWDLTSQFDKENKIGLGAEARVHTLENFYTIFRAANQDTSNVHEIVYPQFGSPGRDEYTKEPREFFAYVQDKMEYQDLIINLGVRFDYFNPNTDMPSDLRNPLFNPLFPSGTKEASVKTQLSPRLAVAFPISANGVIRGSYGHFFQIPPFDQLYRGIYDEGGVTKTQVASSTGESGSLDVVVGNPDLQPQRTTKYELGLRQVLYTDLAMEVVAYYNDIRNLVDTEIIETYDGKKYARFINRDYGNSRGVIVSLEKRFSGNWGARLDYTYQIAEGNASDPQSVFQDNQTNPPNETEKKTIRLDWDQRSTLNFSLITGVQRSWNASLTGRLGSGTPYTADRFFNPVDITFRNDRNKPPSVTFDLRFDKFFRVAGAQVTTFLLIYNLFDRLNEVNVYGSSGRAGYDYNTKFAGDIVGLNTIDDYINNPTFYSSPREVRVGLSFGL